jgi:hypothetical protein
VSRSFVTPIVYARCNPMHDDATSHSCTRATRKIRWNTAEALEK